MFIMKYTEEYKIAVLNWAKENGTTIAARHFKLQSSTIIRWNKKYNIYQMQPMRSFTEEQKVEILMYAETCGLTNAMRLYKVDTATIQDWNKTRAIYTGKKDKAQNKKKRKIVSEDKILEILNFAKTNGASAAIQKYNVPQSTLQNWNKKYKVYETRQATKYSDETKQMITDFAQRYSIAEAARKFALPGHLIKKWLQATNGKHK